MFLFIGIDSNPPSLFHSMRSSFDGIGDATGRRNETILESTGGVLTSCLMALKTNDDRRIDFVCVLASLVLNRLLLSAYRFLVLADVRLYGPTLLLQTLNGVFHLFIPSLKTWALDNSLVSRRMSLVQSRCQHLWWPTVACETVVLGGGASSRGRCAASDPPFQALILLAQHRR